MKNYILTIITISIFSISLNAQRTTGNEALRKQTEVNQRSTDNQSIRNQPDVNQRSTDNQSIRNQPDVNQRVADSRQNVQKQELKQNTGYPQYIFILATENMSGKITNIKVTGKVSFENVEIKTREDKEKIHASMKASEAFEKVESISNIFEVANVSFTFESHNIVQLDKELKHYILFSTK